MFAASLRYCLRCRLLVDKDAFNNLLPNLSRKFCLTRLFAALIVPI